MRFRAYCYVRVFTVTWYSTEVGELTEDAVLQTASVEFGKSVPPYTGETPSKPGYNFDKFVVYTPEGETAGSTTNVTKDLALRPSFTAIEYLISIAGPNGSYAQYDQLNQEKSLNADGDAAYRYGEMIRLTEGVNNVPPSVHYSDIEEIGYDITGWSVSDGSYFMYDSAAGKWYLPTAKTPERETDVLIVAGGVYYTRPERRKQTIFFGGVPVRYRKRRFNVATCGHSIYDNFTLYRGTDGNGGSRSRYVI